MALQGLCKGYIHALAAGSAKGFGCSSYVKFRGLAESQDLGSEASRSVAQTLAAGALNPLRREGKSFDT